MKMQNANFHRCFGSLYECTDSTKYSLKHLPETHYSSFLLALLAGKP